ncbi:DUF3027 domain-containing protein [Nocardia cyriacigeorgica]|uniref:DUF3027 domain-containing protein n=1 Tax=Nocardia cyriacigeorgica TaxID=135487 RepID=UPI001E42E46C|nr:DUF3027 domain-containing protein [Nocardia cyriacigeorgica]
MSAVSVSDSGVRPVLADAVELARRALLELEPSGVGAHLGVSAEDDNAATHRFEATLAGYRGWQWAVVVAAPPGADQPTVSESALLPGPDALIAPEFVPWDQRVRPGDLAPGDLLAPPPNDPRLAPGYTATGDPEIDEVAYQVGLGRSQVLSLEGREEAAQRWYTEFGPDTEMAKAAPGTCGTCGFYLPLAGALRACFGVCGNAMGADGHVVHTEYGCGAHSDVTVPTGAGSPLYEAYDDAAVDLVPTESLRAAGNSEADDSATARIAEALDPGINGRQDSADAGTEGAESVSAAAAAATKGTGDATAEAADAGGVAPLAEAADPAPSADANTTVESADAADMIPAAEATEASGVASAEGAEARPVDVEPAEAVESADRATVIEPADAATAADGPATAVEPAGSDTDRPAETAAPDADEAASSPSETEQATASIPASESSNGTGESESPANSDRPETDAQSESGSSALS